MKIKLKINAFGSGIGDIINVSQAVGDRLIKSNDAEPADETPRKAAKMGKPANKAISARE